MIALTDEQINVVSCDETVPSDTPYSLAYRDYMQELYKTGQYQITDAFVAGADHETMNYTIAVPIWQDGVVKGSVFGSIYFNDIKDIIERNLQNNSNFYLLSSTGTIMAGDDQNLIGKSFLEATKDMKLIGTTAEEVVQNMDAGITSSNWEWEDHSLWYVAYSKVPPTDWTIAYRVQFTSVLWMLLPGVLAKFACYIFICVAVYFLGPRYLKKHLADINYLLDRMSSMQKELFQTEYASYDNLLDLTTGGLTDQLTGLATRLVFYKRSQQMIKNNAQNHDSGALMLVDLDDLKFINDNYGHEAGDLALSHIGTILKQYELAYNGIAARYGGDEFTLILDHCPAAEVVQMAASLCTEFHTTLTFQDASFQIHGSIGIALYPQDGNSLEELISKADLALYSAKRAGKNQYALYSDNHLNHL